MKITKFITVVVAILMGSSNLSAQTMSYDGSLQYYDWGGTIIVEHTVTGFPFTSSSMNIHIVFSSTSEVTSFIPTGSVMPNYYEWEPSGINMINSDNYHIYGTLTHDAPSPDPGGDIPIGDIIKRAIPNVGPRSYSEEFILVGPVPDEVWLL